MLAPASCTTAVAFARGLHRVGRPFAKRVMSGEASTASAKAVAKKREREELSGSPGGETTVVEGSATLYFASDKGVFYNPAQIPNRDLSVLGLRQFVDDWRAAKLDKAKTRAAKAYASAVARGDAAAAAEAQAPLAAPTARVLDALSASGLRTIRYAKEVEGLSEVVANDLDAAAVEAMGENFARNGLESPLATSHVGDACAYLHESRPPTGERFQVVDLDPYGSAAPFLDAAVQSVDDGSRIIIKPRDARDLDALFQQVQADKETLGTGRCAKS